MLAVSFSVTALEALGVEGDQLRAIRVLDSVQEPHLDLLDAFDGLSIARVVPLLAYTIQDLDVSTLSIGSRRVLSRRLHLQLVEAFIYVDVAGASVKGT